ncbi:MAG: SRPBCC domain-containing protein, partial [Saprospiraceae bacterium]
MEASGKTTLVVEATVSAPAEKVWAYWTAPEHITQWNQASDDWHCPSASNDLRVGGSFSAKMAAKDGSFEFGFEGIYDEVEMHKKIAYTLGDDRKVSVMFTADGNAT